MGFLPNINANMQRGLRGIASSPLPRYRFDQQPPEQQTPFNTNILGQSMGAIAGGPLASIGGAEQQPGGYDPNLLNQMKIGAGGATPPLSGYLSSLFGQRTPQTNPIAGVFGNLLGRMRPGLQAIAGGMFGGGGQNAQLPTMPWGQPQTPLPRTQSQTRQGPSGPGLKISYQPGLWGNPGAATPYDPNAIPKQSY